MRVKEYIFLLSVFALFFISTEVEGGCNGSCSVSNGDDWTITQDTHMWDETIEIKDLIVNSQADLKLENVEITITGHVSLYGDTMWLNSDVIHLRTEKEQNITVEKDLEIIGTNVRINTTGEEYVGGQSVSGFFLTGQAKLIVRDGDNNPETTGDASIIEPHNWNASLWWMTAIEYVSAKDSGQIIFENSIFKYMIGESYGDNTVISNNSFIECGWIRYRGDNLVYENNTHNNGLGREYNSQKWNLDYYGNNGLIQYNNFTNGVSGIFVDGGNNTTIRHNEFFNMSGQKAIELLNYSNSTVYGNQIEKVQAGLQNWNSNNTLFYDNIITDAFGAGVFLTGSNLTITDNVISNCGTVGIIITNEAWYYDSTGTTMEHSNVIIRNNTVTNATYGIAIGSGDRQTAGIVVNENTVTESDSGILIAGWNEHTKMPNGFIVDNNTLRSNNYGIYLSSTGNYEQIMYGGENSQIINNDITNSSIGIEFSGKSNLYDNSIINNNIIEANDTGLEISTAKELVISNNLIFAKNSGISALECDDLMINNNNITTEFNGIKIDQGSFTITDNLIQANCNSEDCQKISFVKVGNKGLEIIGVKDSKISKNIIDLFYTNVEIKDSDLSDFQSFYDNKLNFSQRGIYAHSSDIILQSNNITNSYYSIESKDSTITMRDILAKNFNTGIMSSNTTFDIEDSTIEEGEVCIDLTDSYYTIDSFDNLDCVEAYVYEKFTFKIIIQTNEGIVSPQHSFTYKNNIQSEIKTDYTQSNGESEYTIVNVRKIDNSGLTINFNPYTFSYIHNSITSNIIKDIESNVTIYAYLDTIAPVTTVWANGTLLNEEIIYLNFQKLSEKEDLLNYDLYVHINDGIQFTEWDYVGTYNQSIVKYEGIDGNKYRFKSISRDIYGNIESKTTFDYELGIDIEGPTSHFAGIGSNYYFTSNDEVLLDWDSFDSDIYKYNIEIYYTNFTTDYLDPNSVVWLKASDTDYIENSFITYKMEAIGHYAFKVVSTDNADNLEIKTNYDFIINFDPSSDKLAFTNVPEKWGESELQIEFEKANFNLDFKLYIALESVDYENPYFNWYAHPHDGENENILLTSLLDKTRYYLYAESVDLAGNIEDPLNTTEYFSANGQYDQILGLNYIPLLRDQYPFILSVDNDLDGSYETLLTRSDKLEGMTNFQYYLDVDNKTVNLGTRKGGFVPTEDLENINNIKVTYSGVHAIFEVYTGSPDEADSLNIVPTNVSHIVFGYNVPKDSSTCKVQMSTNLSKGWFNQEILSPCDKGYQEYTLENPQLDKEYYFRIMIEDEFGHASYSDNRSVKMEDVVKLFSTSGAEQNNQFGMKEILPAAIGISLIFLLFGGVLLYRSNNEELDENVSVIESKPVAQYKIEELYLIYKDGRLIQNLSAVEVKTDSDIMSGMLTAINDFVQDSFNTEGDLGSIDYGNNKIILQRGNHSYLAAVIYGEIENKFKGKLFRSVAQIENLNPTINAWNGDSTSIIQVKENLKPIIEDTALVTREMVDNYFTEKEIVMTSSYEKEGTTLKVTVNLSNYSSDSISNCKINPQYNDTVLSLSGIDPDLLYSFTEGNFVVGEINPYNEVQFIMKMNIKAAMKTSIEVKMNYEQKGRNSDVTSIVEIE